MRAIGYVALVAFACGTAGCAGEPRSLCWRVDSSAVPAATAYVIEIRRGGCAADAPVVYSAQFRAGESSGAMRPPVLARGRYGFVTAGLDPTCAEISTGCTEIDLPAADGSCAEVPLTAGSGVRACAAEACSDGICTALDGGGPDASTACSEHADCSDGTFCNGLERCTPEDPAADARGCLPAEREPCAATQTCDEAMDRCISDCGEDPDADDDGHRAIECAGDDCDDGDAARYPGNPEVCEARDHDEDCNPATYGFLDADGDDSPDAQCCNDDGVTRTCGDDCNDSRRAVRPGAVETCDEVDEDCDGRTDEGVAILFYSDADGDGYGDAAAPTRSACVEPDGFASNADDCDDGNAMVHPGAADVCDATGLDDDCNGTANDPPGGCACTPPAMRGCTLPGACASGMETCVGSSWGACSISPATEVCNGVDDDCDGAADDGTTVDCWADGDADGYAGSGATMSAVCPDAAGGCPGGSTTRAPLGAAIDCDDADPNRSPGDVETCNYVDDDCDGATDEMLLVLCYSDADDDGFAPAAAVERRECPRAGRDAVGGCPMGSTNRAPGPGLTDCEDDYAPSYPGGTETCDAARHDEDCDGTANPMTLCTCTIGMTRACPDPGRCASGMQTCAGGAWGPCSISPTTESCNGIDDDCNGVVDDGSGIGTTCWADADGDGYAPAGAATSMACTCPAGTTSRAPGDGGASDCNDADFRINPGAAEMCDRIDSNCSGAASARAEDVDMDGHSPTAAMCSGGFPRDDCNDSMATVYTGAPEVCNGRDDNCNMMIDEGMTCVGMCTGSTNPFTGRSYVFCAEAVEWNDAATACAGRGMQLVRVNDAAENTFVASEGQRILSSSFWLGGREVPAGGSRIYDWQDGTRFWNDGPVPGVYTNWDAGEPGNHAGDDCVKMDVPSGRWRVHRCSEVAEYACEAP